ncbi:MAG: serine/threonine protein kinase [Planctomycetes bacterium]|nr:serine/threonine protein kinase [Planctomycetota bacterium]
MARLGQRLKLKPDDVIGRWCVVKKLGEGGCGSVYRCRNLKRPDEEAAVKILENLSDEQRFKRERQVLEAARSPYIVRLIESGRHEGVPFLALEFMAGGSLREVMDERGRVPAKEAAWILVMALRGLRSSKTVHRDIKPENLLLTRPGGRNAEMRFIPGDVRRGSCVKVADFGLAKAWDPSMTKITKTGQVMGTPLYMSPEQCRNTRDVTVHSDIYALGVIFYELVVGKPPFDADNAYDLMAKHCNEPVTIPRGMDPAVREVVERCLAKQPRERFGSLIALERKLSDIAGLGEPEPEPRWSWTTWVILVAGLSAFVAIAWILRDSIRQALGL